MPRDNLVQFFHCTDGKNLSCEDLGDFMKTEQDSSRAGIRHQEYLV